jgi:hypothetical protein
MEPMPYTNGAMLHAAGNTPLIINGEVVSPDTHSFKDGKPVFNKDGTVRKKMGRRFGSKNPAKAPGQSEAAPVDAAPVESVPAVAAPTTVEVKVEVAAPVASPPVAAVPPPPAPAPAPAPVKAKPAVVKPVTATVTRSYGKIGAQEATDETIEVKGFAVPPAQVELGYGLTLNIGNYESARVDVKVSVPCYREEADAAYEWAKQWAEERVRQAVSAVRKLAVPNKTNPF